jgi:hypothetical protein
VAHACAAQANEWAAHDYDTKSNHDSFLLCADGLNSGKYAFNNVRYLNHYIGSTIQIRPEIRFDHAWDRPATTTATRAASSSSAPTSSTTSSQPFSKMRQPDGRHIRMRPALPQLQFGMRIQHASIALCLCTILCQAQVAKTDQALLTEVREKYDAPFNRNLRSFDCAVVFSWKDHFKETYRVGDEGTDEELEKIFQPINTHVTVTRDKVTTSAVALTEDAITKLPHGGMAEFLLEHAVQKSLSTWLAPSTNALLPPPSTPVHFEQSTSGYKLAFKMQAFAVEMAFTPDFRLQSASAKGPQSDHFETSFVPGKQGFLLSSFTVTEDGNSEPGHRLIFTYAYQTVDGLQLPENVAIIRESHREIWRYKLSNCTVKTTQ